MGPLALGGDGDQCITMGMMTMKMMIRLNGNKTIKDYREPRMVQAKMKYNHEPTGDWKELIKKLNKRFKGIKKIEKPKIEVYNKISGQKNTLDSSNIKTTLPLLHRENQFNYEDDLPF